MNKKTKKILNLSLLIISVIALVILINVINPKNIVNYFGIKNIYISLFIISLFAGISSFTTTPLYLAVITFSLGGGNLFLIGFIGGSGMIVGDSLFFHIGRKTRDITNKEFNQKIKQFSDYLDKKHHNLIPFIIIFYCVFVPLPKDFLLAALGLSRYTYKRALIPVLIGNIIGITLLAILTFNGIKLLGF